MAKNKKEKIKSDEKVLPSSVEIKPGVPSNVPSQFQNSASGNSAMTKEEAENRELYKKYNIDPDTKEVDNSAIDEQVDKELANTKDEYTGLKKEILDGQRGESKGNPGDNDLAYNNYEEKFMPTNGVDQTTYIFGDQGETKSIEPKPENTSEVTERHKEELAQLENAVGGPVATGTILNQEPVTSEAEIEEGENPNGSGSSGNKSGESELSKAPEEANLDFSDYIKNYYGPKNGADYVKALWNNGEYGKAVGNVLGNLLGSLGTINVGGASTGGRDFHSDWEDYRNNYTKAQAERNQQAFDQNMEISKQLRTNDVARNEMLKTLENYQKIGGKLTDEQFQNIRKAMTATGKGSQMDYYLASILGDISSDPKFKEAAKEAIGQAAELIGNLAQFGAATIKPLNYIFGGDWK